MPYKLINEIKNVGEFVARTVHFLTILNFSAEKSGENNAIFIKHWISKTVVLFGSFLFLLYVR